MNVKNPMGKDYDIVIGDSFDALPGEIETLGLAGKKACIITDTNVEPLYAEAVKEKLSGVFSEVSIFAFEAGEQNKNLATVQKIYTHLIKGKFDRKDVIVALGGGVVGDTAGFAAATYLRGIDFIQIPTSLLAMVDSSVGGKTGVDFDSYKNMVGAFHMPRLVYTNTAVLASLPKREFACGMAEVLKAGLIKDGNFYGFLINNLYEIDDKEPEVMRQLIADSCDIKRRVVEKDPMEAGERALLNFGHTIGHAIEKAKGFSLTHGECVALGSVAAAFISYKRQFLSFDEYYEIRDMFVPFDLPITVRDIDPQEILKLTKNDKKMDGGKIRFVLLKKIGKAVVETDVTDEELLAGIGEIYVSEEDLKE
ncbi:MAG: 3-dehydroquinate synthase [Lachnospiraceae bacterium]|nr:3-dehydroquinate synthase [Lachnospiraceae bacterium]